MNKIWDIFKAFALTCLILLIFNCSGSIDVPGKTEVEVGFGIVENPSKTTIDASHGKFLWEDGDKVSLWAKNSDGSFTLNNQIFNLLSTRLVASGAYFTSTLDEAMPDGTYTYYLAYPVPTSVNGTSATFSLPSVQDGKAGNGVDIIIAEPTVYGPLSEYDESLPIEDGDGMNVKMKHLLHFLRFYIPEGYNALGEPVERIEVTMPQAIVGTVTADVTDGSASLSESSRTVTMNLEKGLEESANNVYSYAVAGIFPPATTYGAGETMSVTLYSASKIATVDPIKLTGRNFEAGHITSVPLKPTSVSDYYTAIFRLATNNLGEEVQKVTLSLPSGVNWPGTSSNEYVYSSDFLVGDSFSISTASQSEFLALSGQSLTVSYESEDAIVYESLTLPDLSSSTRSEIAIDCPYLLYEDFQNASTGFSKNGDLSSTGHSTSTIEGSSYGLAGWTGNQVAVIEANGNKALAIRHQNETYLLQGTYRGRADSTPLGHIKTGKSIKVSVSFNYTGYANGSTPMMSYGYTTTSGEISGYYEGGSSIISGGSKIENIVGEKVSSPTDGSAGNVALSAGFEIDGCTSSHRLSWDCYGSKSSGTSQQWVIIDNVKVQIIK